MIAVRAVGFELHVQWIKIGLAHLRGPPEARVCENQFRELVGREGYVFGLVRSELYVLLELDCFNLSLELAFDWLACPVLDLGRHRELCAVVRRHIQFRYNRRVAQSDRS